MTSLHSPIVIIGLILVTLILTSTSKGYVILNECEFKNLLSLSIVKLNSGSKGSLKLFIFIIHKYFNIE